MSVQKAQSEDVYIHAGTLDDGKDVVQMLKDPVTERYTGHALVRMQSIQQAEWVRSDLNEMIFTLGMGPRPLQASVAQPGRS